MRYFTIENPGRVVPGIAVTDGHLAIGIRGADGTPLRVPIDARATVLDGRATAAAGIGAIVLLLDHSGAAELDCAWYLRAAQPDERWDAMLAAERIPNALDRILAQERVRARYPHRAPAGWYEFARGYHEPRQRARVNLFGYLERGASMEVRRRGRLEGTPSVLLVACRGDEVVVSDPRALALARAQARMPGGAPSR